MKLQESKFVFEGRVKWMGPKEFDDISKLPIQTFTFTLYKNATRIGSGEFCVKLCSTRSRTHPLRWDVFIQNPTEIPVFDYQQIDFNEAISYMANEYKSGSDIFQSLPPLQNHTIEDAEETSEISELSEEGVNRKRRLDESSLVLEDLTEKKRFASDFFLDIPVSENNPL